MRGRCGQCGHYVEWDARRRFYAALMAACGKPMDPAMPCGLCLRSADAPYPVSAVREGCLLFEEGKRR